ncbi:apolipoprotein C-II [Aulostomus maculatus]
MKKLLVITVLVALFALSAESFRVPRQTVEEPGTLTKFSNAVKAYYNRVVDTANDYLERMKSLELKQRVKNFYEETTVLLGTYGGILQDQIYHVYDQQ